MRKFQSFYEGAELDIINTLYYSLGGGGGGVNAYPHLFVCALPGPMPSALTCVLCLTINCIDPPSHA